MNNQYERRAIDLAFDNDEILFKNLSLTDLHPDGKIKRTAFSYQFSVRRGLYISNDYSQLTPIGKKNGIAQATKYDIEQIHGKILKIRCIFEPHKEQPPTHSLISIWSDRERKNIEKYNNLSEFLDESEKDFKYVRDKLAELFSKNIIVPPTK